MQGDLLGTSWSLSDEALFYVLFPFLLLPIARRWTSWRRIMVGLWLLGLTYYVVVSLSVDGFPQIWALDYLPPARVVQFVAGIVVGIAFIHGRRAPMSIRTAVLLLVGWNLFLLAWERAPSWIELRPFSGSQALVFPLFGLLIWAIADRDRDGRPSRLLASPVAIRLGHWSYAWYLVHRAGILLWLRLAGLRFGPAARGRRDVQRVGRGATAGGRRGQEVRRRPAVRQRQRVRLTGPSRAAFPLFVRSGVLDSPRAAADARGVPDVPWS